MGNVKGTTKQLETAKNEWNQKRAERLDWISKNYRREHDAAEQIKGVDTAMERYAMVFGKESLDREPQLSDFYTPSSEQRERETAFIIGGMVVMGLIAYKLS